MKPSYDVVIDVGFKISSCKISDNLHFAGTLTYRDKLERATQRRSHGRGGNSSTV